MVKVNVNEDCGNAPKKQIILDLLVFTARGEIDKVLQLVTSDIEIELVGRSTTGGVEEFKSLLETDGARSIITELKIDNILSHGDRCAANGVWKFSDGRSVAFNNIYEFENHASTAKVKRISVYSILLK